MHVLCMVCMHIWCVDKMCMIVCMHIYGMWHMCMLCVCILHVSFAGISVLFFFMSMHLAFSWLTL